MFNCVYIGFCCWYGDDRSWFRWVKCGDKNRLFWFEAWRTEVIIEVAVFNEVEPTIIWKTKCRSGCQDIVEFETI